MPLTFSRRRFIQVAAGAALAPGALALPSQPPLTITRIAGSPRERGALYGKQFRKEIGAFLEAEIYRVFTGKPKSKAEMLAYAAACGTELRTYSPEVADELAGMAEGAGISNDEALLLSLHEELTHGRLRAPGHCTAVAVGPPRTGGATFVGQTWDWMESVKGLSAMLDWKRSEGPGVLAYGYPGMPCGAGVNSAGLALCWTSAAFDQGEAQPRVGIPSYALLTHLLYQATLDDVIREARRAKLAGWFTFVMADASGRLLNLEGSTGELAVEEQRGAMARVYFGSRQMTRTPEGKPVKFQGRCQRALDQIAEATEPVDLQFLQRLFTDKGGGISVDSTLDAMVFDCTAPCAWMTRGTRHGVEWKRFGFGG